MERVERLSGVARMIYLIFNEGYSAGANEAVARARLSEEAIRLGRLLQRLFPAEPEIMGLAALWRCVCNLCMWGRSATVRFRLIAIFYGSVYIYERLRLHDVMLFTDWHMHVFRCPSLLKKGGLGIIPLHVCRVHYMEQHTPGTFFGMTHPRAAVTFNTTLKAGQVWCDVVREVLQRAADSVDIYFRDRVVLAKIFAFKNLLTQQVNSEKGLFCFLSRYGPLRAFAKGKLKREGAGALG